MWCKSITSNLLAFPLVSWNFLMIPISDLDWKKRSFERRGSLPKTWLGLELRPLDLKSRFETTRRLLILIAELTFLIFFFFNLQGAQTLFHVLPVKIQLSLYTVEKFKQETLEWPWRAGTTTVKNITDFLTLFCSCGFTYHANRVDHQNSFHDSDLSRYRCDVARVSKSRLVYLWSEDFDPLCLFLNFYVRYSNDWQRHEIESQVCHSVSDFACFSQGQ